MVERRACRNILSIDCASMCLVISSAHLVLALIGGRRIGANSSDAQTAASGPMAPARTILRHQQHHQDRSVATLIYKLKGGTIIIRNNPDNLGHRPVVVIL